MMFSRPTNEIILIPKGTVRFISEETGEILGEINNLWYPGRPISGDLEVHLL